MKCKIPNRETLIDNYLSRNISTNEAEQFEEHYFACDICSKETKFRQELKKLIEKEGKELLNNLTRLPKKKSLKEIIKSIIDKLIQPPVWIPATAMILVVLLVGSGSFLVKDTLTKDPISEFAYDDKVPYDYTGSGFRGTDARPETDPELRTFHRQYLLAMGDYMTFNYQEAIEILEPLESTVNEFSTRLNNKEIISDARDYYFYLGVSHYALGRSEKLGKEVKAEHIEKAIPYLERAERIALTSNFEPGDRETYYLGLVYGFSGNKDSAVIQFGKIKPESEFYKNSIELIQEWSEK